MSVKKTISTAEKCRKARLFFEDGCSMLFGVRDALRRDDTGFAITYIDSAIEKLQLARKAMAQ